MLWPAAILIAAAVVLATLGWRVARRRCAPDGREAGLLWLAAGVTGTIAIAVTWKAFS